MVFSDMDKILIKKTHKYSQNTVIRIEELKSVHLKCTCLHFLLYLRHTVVVTRLVYETRLLLEEIGIMMTVASLSG